MLRHVSIAIIMIFTSLACWGQEPSKAIDTTASQENRPSSPFVSGYYPIYFFDVDLKYLIKYNNYESFRLGFGGITNERLSPDFKVNGYIAYGFKDDDYKYNLGGNFRVSKKTKSWIGLEYTKDIREIGSFTFLTSKRVYSVFEPRLINITQFYKHRTWTAKFSSEPTDKLIAELELNRNKIDQIEDYTYLLNDESFHNYHITEGIISLRYAPKTLSFTSEEGLVESFDGFPKISFQFSQGIKGISKSDFNFTKLGLKLDYYIKRKNLSSSNFVLEGAMAFGDLPLPHLFHAYPNNPTKDEILQRFSVAGRQSFETMYFGEFFSDRLLTFRGKHTLRRFKLGEKWKPELVFITRHAIGNMDNIERHQGLPFNTLEHVYSESGFELNRIVLGFGLSFAYRYGYYHLPKPADNVSVKFTFNLKL